MAELEHQTSVIKGAIVVHSKLHCCPYCKLVTVNAVVGTIGLVPKNNIEHKDTSIEHFYRMRHVLVGSRYLI